MKALLQGSVLGLVLGIVILIGAVWYTTTHPLAASAANGTSGSSTTATSAPTADAAAPPAASGTGGTTSGTSTAPPTQPASTAQAGASMSGTAASSAADSSMASSMTAATSGASSSASSTAASSTGGTLVRIASANLTGDTVNGADLYDRQCLSCHNRDGQSFVPQYPRLNAQLPGYLAEQLMDFKGGKRVNAIMTPIAARLSSQNIADLSAYLSTTPVARPWQVSNQTLHDQGAKLYANGVTQTGLLACQGCHGQAGEGNAAAGFPRIGGQGPAYFATRIHELAAMQNATGTAATMVKIARAMKPDQIQALAEYVKTLPNGGGVGASDETRSTGTSGASAP